MALPVMSTPMAPVPYCPAFRLDEDERCTWVCDGEQRIALFYPAMLNLDWWADAPGQSLVAQPQLPAHYDMGTLLNLHAMIHWRLSGPDIRPETLTHRWEVTADGVTLTVAGQYADGGHTTHVWRVWYDAALERYRYTMAADLWITRQADIEFVNFYPARTLHSDPAQRRFTHTVWRDETGAWCSMPHASALTLGFTVAGTRKYLPAQGAEFGYVTDPQCNPFCRVLESSRPLHIGTCDMWWDEHLIIPAPSMQQREDGLYHSWATVEWDNRPPEDAAAILREAQPVPTFPRDTQRVAWPVLHVGEVCDFSTTAQFDDSNDNIIFTTGHTPWLTWLDDPARAHSGQRALAMQGSTPARSYFANGANLQVNAGGKARFTAWINTEQLQGQAWIELRSFRMQVWDIERTYTSRRIPGGSGWVQVIIEGETADSPYLHPFLWVEGTGDAVFDDLLIEVLD